MLLQNLLLRPAPLIAFFLSKPKPLHIPLQATSLIKSHSPLLPPSRLPSHAVFFSSEALLELPTDVVTEGDDEDFGAGSESEEIVSATVAQANNKPPTRRNLPNLSVKEKKELASYAHGLGKKLKSQQVGKSGVTDTVVMALDETLEANELLKLKIHNNCPGELDDVVEQLEKSTGSVIVGRIGRTVILYRPSVTKMKLEEKKKQALMLLNKKQSTLKPLQSRNRPPGQGQPPPRQSGRGRRGSSRVPE